MLAAAALRIVIIIATAEAVRVIRPLLILRAVAVPQMIILVVVPLVYM